MNKHIDFKYQCYFITAIGAYPVSARLNDLFGLRRGLSGGGLSVHCEQCEGVEANNLLQRRTAIYALLAPTDKLDTCSYMVNATTNWPISAQYAVVD